MSLFVKTALVLSVCFLVLECRSEKQSWEAAQGPFFLHVWLYQKKDSISLVRIVDSSHLHYSYQINDESDGTHLVSIRFKPDPSRKKITELLTRVARYKGSRGYVTTRGNQNE